jgi:hypothetical protein
LSLMITHLILSLLFYCILYAVQRPKLRDGRSQQLAFIEEAFRVA